MKNLENYGVLELNAKEIRETDGGWVIAVIALAITVANTDWDKAGASFSKGWHSL